MFEDDGEAKYLVVSVTTWHEGAIKQDSSCILEAGCHPFIRHKSWIDYTRSQPMTFADIFNGLQRGTFIRKEDMPPAEVVRIQEGAKQSLFFPVELRAFFQFF